MASPALTHAVGTRSVPAPPTTSPTAEELRALIGPGSPWYETLAIPTMYLYGSIPYLIMPTLHPKIAHVLKEKDRILNGSQPADTAQKGLRRMVNTYEMVAGIIYNGDEGLEVAHGLFELHRPVAGKFEDGKRYHAWNADMWTWTWGSIVKAGFDIYVELHGRGPVKGQPFDEFMEQAYQGGVALGQLFGVRHLPGTYAEFEQYWDEIVRTTLEDNPQARYIVANALQPPKFEQLQWLPDPAWRVLSLPVARVIRAGILLGVPDSAHPLIGVERTRLDQAELLLHKAVWRSLPRPLLSKFAPAYFAARRRFGTPAWRAEYSRAQLAADRAAAQAASN